MSRAHYLVASIAIALPSCLATEPDDTPEPEIVAVARNGKVEVCHVPPGNPGNAHTIEVGLSAVDAHLAHGDYLGECRRHHSCQQVCTPSSQRSCYDGPNGTRNIGICRGGTQTCNGSGSAWGSCNNDVLPAATDSCADNLDNDCDGTVNEGCVCAPAAPAACYTGPPGTLGVGVCTAGTKVCNPSGTGYGACGGQVRPSAEVCGDNLDNDCDGSVDEGCVCAPGATTACEGVAVGQCSTGEKTCDAAGTAWGACVGVVGPVAEVCGNDLDENCDGTADDGCVCTAGQTTSCEDPTGTAGVGECRAGERTCNNAGTDWGACVGAVGPVAEVCDNGLDEDCDGVPDDGCVCAPGQAEDCTAGLGECSAGTKTCNPTGTAWGACVGAVGPVGEVCGDGLDNDCDGTIENGCVEVCIDGIDNDGNGAIDDGCVCAPGEIVDCLTDGHGVCEPGRQLCNPSGTAYGSCVGLAAPSSEVCGDGLDNDCDGHADEGCVSGRVWHDLDQDGAQEAGEPGLAEWSLVLWRRMEVLGIPVDLPVFPSVATTASGPDGVYGFADVLPGDYYIQVIPRVDVDDEGTPIPVRWLLSPAWATDVDLDHDSDFVMRWLSLEDADGDGEPDEVLVLSTRWFTVADGGLVHLDAGFWIDGGV